MGYNGKGEINEINFGKGCKVSTGLIWREVMFALGAAAEYRRPDRDLFVSVKLENVKPNMKRLFTKVPNGNTYGLPYDHFSVMAVSLWDMDGKEVVVPKDTKIMKHLGKMDEVVPSLRDITLLNRMYKCDAVKVEDVKAHYARFCKEGSKGWCSAFKQ